MRHGQHRPSPELRVLLERMAALAKEARRAEYPALAARLLELYTEAARQGGALEALEALEAPPLDRRAAPRVSQAR